MGRSLSRRIVADLEAHLDQPLPPRQLERLIQSRFSGTPGGYHLKLRLQAARNHPFYGDMPIQEIAMATGISSPSVLSRSFKARFGLSPRQFRDQFARERLQRFRPEVRQQLALGSDLLRDRAPGQERTRLHRRRSQAHRVLRCVVVHLVSTLWRGRAPM